MASGLTTALGQFIASMNFEKLPASALPIIRAAFSDTIAVSMIGVTEPVVGVVSRTLVSPGSKQEARICLSRTRTIAFDAALVGGTAAHAIDYDDQAISGHPSAVLVPAVLAEGETLNSTGKDLVTAYATGYEVWAELLRRDSRYHRKGWHPTSVLGVIGATAATATLRRLSSEGAAAALAIAASHSSGLAANFGTMVKPYHAGMAARGGVVSTRLAATGMTAASDGLEQPRGFLNAFSPDVPDLISPTRIGENWDILSGICVKKYPTCYFMHRSFEATRKMVSEAKVSAEDISEVEVIMGSGQADVLVNTAPKTALEAKFSEQFAIAAAVVLGRMGVEEVCDSVVQRPDVQAFFPKVKLIPVDQFDSRDPAHSPTERVKVRLKSGEALDSGPITTIRGHAFDPLTLDEQWEKFASCTSRSHTPSQARQLFEMLQAIDTLPSARALPTCEALPI